MSKTLKPLLSACALLALALLGPSIHSAPPPAPTELSAADRQHLLYDDFVVVRTVTTIPASVQATLVGHDKRSGMANPGQPFQQTDVIFGPLPRRRLIFAGVSTHYCLVCDEYGGFVSGTEVSLYRLSADHAVLAWHAGLRIYSKTLTLPQLREQVRARKLYR